MNECTNDKCGVMFHPGPGSTGKFCSKSCAAKVNNRITPKRKRKTIPITCKGCEKTFHGLPARKFCSRRCFDEKRSDVYIDRWLSGDENGSDASGELKKIIRKRLLKLAGNKCTKCNWSEENPYIRKVILTIDHVDGN